MSLEHRVGREQPTMHRPTLMPRTRRAPEPVALQHEARGTTPASSTIFQQSAHRWDTRRTMRPPSDRTASCPQSTPTAAARQIGTADWSVPLCPQPSFPSPSLPFPPPFFFLLPFPVQGRTPEASWPPQGPPGAPEGPCLVPDHLNTSSWGQP